MGDYSDHWISCTASGIEIRGYYFPWGTKRVPWGQVRGVRKVALTALRGKGRIWGTGNPRYWANLDPKRPGKSTGYLLDLGKAVKPFLTPDDPTGFEGALGQFVPTVPVADGAGPFV